MMSSRIYQDSLRISQNSQNSQFHKQQFPPIPPGKIGYPSQISNFDSNLVPKLKCSYVGCSGLFETEWGKQRHEDQVHIAKICGKMSENQNPMLKQNGQNPEGIFNGQANHQMVQIRPIAQVRPIGQVRPMVPIRPMAPIGPIGQFSERIQYVPHTILILQSTNALWHPVIQNTIHTLTDYGRPERK